MKQLGLGFSLWGDDHQDRFPPTAYATGDYQYQLSWDDYLNRYIGGTTPDSDLILGITGDVATIPKILKCPADRIEISIEYSSFNQRRTYAMNWAGPSFIVSNPSGPLPPPDFGVGVYFNLRESNPGSLPNWDPPGYRQSVVLAPAGTILLAELPNGRNAVGNDWPSFCAGPGPDVPENATADCVQTGTGTFNGINYGAVAYGLHGRRFNYLFHDGHVAIYTIGETLGTGTAKAPKGMWTMTPND
jgi:prepilin-type processing-associated H-X9-DG protein